MSYEPERQLFFGDLHVHTALSFDAAISDVRAEPADAYRFAKGEAIEVPTSTGTRTMQLDRPLHFAAVTDHAEYLAEVAACQDPSSAVYDEEICVGLREGSNDALVSFGIKMQAVMPTRYDELCGEGAEDCPALARTVWNTIIDAAEQAYDRTEACTFTSFVAYEWSGARKLSNLHRNIIFRSYKVPSSPISYYEEPTEAGLWSRLESGCTKKIDGCDVMSIPHNANWSNGNLLIDVPASSDAQSLDQQVALANQRARLEPLLEVFQHKGESECTLGLSGVLGAPDELCDFEKLRTPPLDDCGSETGSGGIIANGCISQRDFLRGALLAGLEAQERLGVNPLKLGVIASTDTHNGTPGAVAENDFAGHFGIREGDALLRLTGAIPTGPKNSPGGLVAVWAEENSRESIFDAMRRRETYGTSGPRISVRFFGGWGFPSDLCANANLVSTGYELGVPMGGDLLDAASRPPGQPEDGSPPSFVLYANQDPGVSDQPGRGLERIQIIKGWRDQDGESHVEVFDVAVSSDPGLGVDANTCEPMGAGEATMCGVWTDPSYDPSQRAFYYARVLEAPVCRWSTYDCLSLPVDQRPENCSDGSLSATIQERAWTSPIWH